MLVLVDDPPALLVLEEEGVDVVEEPLELVGVLELLTELVPVAGAEVGVAVVTLATPAMGCTPQ
jgi:hypothetical protein